MRITFKSTIGYLKKIGYLKILKVHPWSPANVKLDPNAVTAARTTLCVLLRLPDAPIAVTQNNPTQPAPNAVTYDQG